jgi:type I restriction enzyme S subunit
MSLNFNYIPLTFLSDEDEIKKQIRNTIILGYFFDRNGSFVKLEDVIEDTQYGYNASALETGLNKFLRISDIANGKVDWATVPFCNCDDEETYLLYSDDILIARTGGTTGKSFLISSPPEHAIYAGYLIRIRAISDNSPEFLKLFLDSYAYWSQIISLNEDEFRPSVNATKLKQLILPNCDLTQQKIAVQISKGENISGYEDLILKIDKTLKDYSYCKEIQQFCGVQKANVELLKQSILQEAIQGKLTEEWRKQNPDIEPASELLKRIKAEKEKLIKDPPAGRAGKKIKKEKPLPPISQEEIPFDLPEGWVWCRLGDITTYGTSEKVESDQIAGETWVLDLEDIEKESSRIIQRKTFKERPSLSTKSLFQKGWVLYSKLRPYLDKIVVADDNGVCTTEILPLPVLNNMQPKFMMLGMKGRHFLKFVNSKVSGMKMPRLRTDDGKIALIPIAPAIEQETIVQKVEALMEKCRVLETEITKSQQHAQILMKAVLKEAFEGKKEEVNV